MKTENCESPVPLTILSGFLGVGKTTLLNRLLSMDLKGRKVALIVNDFGKVVVDGSLIQSRGEEMLQLKNGCICCSLQQNLAVGLAELLQKDAFDRVVMEASGVTNLKNLLQVLKNGTSAFKRVRVDQVVTVVDAERYEAMSRAFAFIVDQVKHADTILMNRCDRVSEDVRQAVRRSLTATNSAARIIETRYCAIDPGVVGLGYGSDRSIREVAPRDTHEHGHPHEDTPWYSSRIVLGSDVALDALRTALVRLPDTIHRLKGFCRADGRIWTVQKAGDVLEIERFERDVSADLIGQIVIIGSSPLQALLIEVFGSWEGVEIIEDTTAHPHHDHH